MYIIAFYIRVWVFQGCRVFILYFAFFGAIWLFSRVDRAFFADDYLATLFLGCLSLRAPSGVASPQILGGKSFDFKRATVFVFDTASQSTK